MEEPPQFVYELGCQEQSRLAVAELVLALLAITGLDFTQPVGTVGFLREVSLVTLLQEIVSVCNQQQG